MNKCSDCKYLDDTFLYCHKVLTDRQYNQYTGIYEKGGEVIGFEMEHINRDGSCEFFEKKSNLGKTLTTIIITILIFLIISYLIYGGL